jgi:hypothetical protein
MVKCEVNVIETTEPREEIKYDEEDLELTKEKKEEDEEETEDDSDPDRPLEGEHEDKELERRLKRANLTESAADLENYIKERKTMIKNKVKDENPFIPDLIKTLAQVKQEKEIEKATKEVKEKEKKTHETIMMTVRDPIPDDMFMKLYGITHPINWELVLYTPMTGWSR